MKAHRFGTVAQLDNASGYGPEDWGFESLRYHTLSVRSLMVSDTFFYVRPISTGNPPPNVRFLVPFALRAESLDYECR